MLTTLSNPKQEAGKAAIIEEQKRGEKAMAEAVKRTREELVEYLREQRRVSPLCTAITQGQSSREQCLSKSCNDTLRKAVLDFRGLTCDCRFLYFL